MIQRILLSGATGFIGSQLLEALLKAHYQMTILKRSTSQTRRIEHVLTKIDTIDTDYNNFTQELSRRKKFDCFIHLATHYIKDHKTERDVQEMIRSNVELPAIITQICLEHGTRYFINTGTFFEYRQSKKPLQEKSPLKPYNFYALTKIMFHQTLQYFAKKSNATVIDLKLFAPYGPKDNEKLIPLLCRALLRQKKIQLTQGEQEWNYTFVFDIVNAYVVSLKNIEKMTGFHTFNVGANQTHSLRDVARKLQEISGKQLQADWGAKPYPENEIFFVNNDYAMIQRAFGWRPQYTIEQGLKITYNYYQNFYGKNIRG